MILCSTKSQTKSYNFCIHMCFSFTQDPSMSIKTQLSDKYYKDNYLHKPIQSCLNFLINNKF